MPLDEVQARDEGASDTCHRAHLRGEKTSFAFYSVTTFILLLSFYKMVNNSNKK